MQTAYTLAPAIGRVGAIADSQRGIHAWAKVAQVAIPFGCAVVRGQDDESVLLPVSAANVTAMVNSGGFAAATHAIISSDGLNDPTVPTFPIGKELAVLRRGAIFVNCEQAVTAGNPVYIRFATSVNTPALVQKGAARKDSDTNTGTATAAILPGAYFKFTTTVAGLAQIELNLGGS